PRAEPVRTVPGGAESLPGPEFFMRARGALVRWEQSVRAGVDLEENPELSAAVVTVHDEAEAVDEALRDDDFSAAALHLTAAAMMIQEWSPEGVAMRVLDRAEARLAGSSDASPRSERAIRLLQSARQELLRGNAMRATQRGLYALQL